MSKTLSQWYDENPGRFRRPLLEEIAPPDDDMADFADAGEIGKPLVSIEVTSISDGRDITRGYVDALPLLPTEDPVLKLKSGGDLKAYEDLYRDPEVKIAWDQRQLALTAKEWFVEPGATDRQSKKAAALVEEALKNLAWDEATKKMQMGVFFGYSVSECLWTKDGANVTLDRIKVKKPRRFGFAPDGSLRLLTTQNPLGELLPPQKFWTFSCGAIDDDEPYGLGLAHWLYWPVWFRKNGDKLWAWYLEKFIAPTAVGKHPPGAGWEQKQALMLALRSIHRDSAIAISDNMMIELLEALKSSGGEYEKFIHRWTNVIYRLILGQSFTVDGSAGVVKGDNMMDVFGQIIKADSDVINPSFSQSVAVWLTQWNYAGATPPRVWRRCEDPIDQERQSNIHKNIFAVGYRPSLKTIGDTYGGEWQTVAAPPQPAAPQDMPQNGTQDAVAAFSESTGSSVAETPEDALDAMIGGLGRQADPLVNKMLDPVRKLLAESADLAEAESRLATLYQQMDADALTALLAEGFVAADLAGRYELRENIGLDS